MKLLYSWISPLFNKAHSLSTLRLAIDTLMSKLTTGFSHIETELLFMYKPVYVQQGQLKLSELALFISTGVSACSSVLTTSVCLEAVLKHNVGACICELQLISVVQATVVLKNGQKIQPTMKDNQTIITLTTVGSSYRGMQRKSRYH